MLDTDKEKKQSKLLSSQDPNENITSIDDENPEFAEGVNEPTELTDEEKRELLIKEIKASKFKFKPIKQDGNITTNKYGTKFKKERKRKNVQARKSRKANRK